MRGARRVCAGLALALAATSAAAGPAPGEAEVEQPPPADLTPAPVWLADDVPKADPAAVAKADALKKKADEAYIAGDYLLALQRLETAYGLDPRPGYVANAGLVLEQLKRYAEAVARMEQFLATDPPAGKAEAARAVIERLTPAVQVESDPAGAVVWRDGQPLGETPLEVRLVAGNVALELRKEGYDVLARTIQVPPRDGLVFRAALAPLPPPPPPPPPPVETGLGHRGWGFVLLGGAGVAGAAAGVFYALGSAAVDDRDAATSRARWDAAHDRVELFDTSVKAAVGVGVVAACAGLGLWLFADDSAVGVAPTVSPDGAGAAVGGRF